MFACISTDNLTVRIDDTLTVTCNGVFLPCCISTFYLSKRTEHFFFCVCLLLFFHARSVLSLLLFLWLTALVTERQLICIRHQNQSMICLLFYLHTHTHTRTNTHTHTHTSSWLRHRGPLSPKQRTESHYMSTAHTHTHTHTHANTHTHTHTHTQCIVGVTCVCGAKNSCWRDGHSTLIPGDKWKVIKTETK